MDKYKIVISGSYGGLNLGDEAILEVILRELRASLDADITVFSKNPQDTQKRHKVRAVPVRQMQKEEVLKELADLDLFVLGGGGILFDGEAEIFLRDVQWAIELGIPVMTYAISAGPLKSSESRRIVLEVLNKVNKITVRENEARKILTDLGITKEIEVTGDPALLLTPSPVSIDLEKQSVPVGVPLVGFSVREPGRAAADLDVDQYHGVLANAADFIIERFKAEVLFVPMEPGSHKDMQHSHSVIAKMTNAQKARILMGDFSPSEILGLMKQMNFAVGMRLHFLIFAAIQRIPFVPLPYAPKIGGFLTDLEIPMPPLMELNAGRLCAFIDRFWDGRDSIRERIDRRIPALQEKAKLTNERIFELLKQRSTKSSHISPVLE